MKKLMVIFTVAILLVMAGTIQAGLTTLADLLPGGSTPSITSGDKVFSSFRDYNSEVDVTTGTASPVDPADVYVTPYQDGAGDYGLKFTSDAFTATGGTLGFLTEFDYTVTAGAGFLICGNTLTIAGTAADGGITVTENAYEAGTTDLLATKVALVTPFFEILTDSKTYTSNVQAVDVHKNISLYMADGSNATNTLTEFTQTFRQIPEPATLVMLALGGLALIRRKCVG
ncbi:MAG: PEP-CTERM sorting domain-containing protein [Phycisphaerae bacterium]|nr:PEP-CTERM sorting domain-containing protein [Phycisphaerae bacterium]